MRTGSGANLAGFNSAHRVWCHLAGFNSAHKVWCHLAGFNSAHRVWCQSSRIQQCAQGLVPILQDSTVRTGSGANLAGFNSAHKVWCHLAGFNSAHRVWCQSCRIQQHAQGLVPILQDSTVHTGSGANLARPCFACS